MSASRVKSAERRAKGNDSESTSTSKHRIWYVGEPPEKASPSDAKSTMVRSIAAAHLVKEQRLAGTRKATCTTLVVTAQKNNTTYVAAMAAEAPKTVNKDMTEA